MAHFITALSAVQDKTLCSGACRHPGNAGYDMDSTESADWIAKISSARYFFVESSIFSSSVPGSCAPGDKIPVPAKAEVTHGNSNRDQQAHRTGKSGL